MKSRFIKYRSFNDKSVATELYRQLREAGIPVQWESTEGLFDVSFTSNDILQIYYIKLRQEDFQRADRILMDSVEQTEQQPIGDYYLFSFSDQELLEVLQQPEDWNAFDQYWAKKLLRARGVAWDEQMIEVARAKRFAEMKKPWIADKIWLLLAFTGLIAGLGLLHFPIIGCVIFLGIYIGFSKKTLPDGERVMAFSKTDRRLGKLTLVLAIIEAVAFFLWDYHLIDFIFPL